MALKAKRILERKTKRCAPCRWSMESPPPMFVKISPAKRRLRTRKRCGNCFVRWIGRSTLDVNQGGFAAKFLASRAEKCLTGIGGALLVVGHVAAYANHFHNSFHF